MRDIMDQFLKNQKYLFAAIFGGLLILFLFWYQIIHKSLSKEHKRMSTARSILSSDVTKFRNLETQINGLQEEWDVANDAFEMVIEKIPDKRLFENVTDFLYSLIINHGLKIENFSPSKAAIEKKTILIPDRGEEVTIEKIPIDITLKGSFINFGQLLESMVSSRYRLTASNIEIVKKKSAKAQTIKLISYAYFQSQSKKYQTQFQEQKIKKESKRPTTLKKNITESKKVNITSAIDEKVNKVDSLDGVPEMWLEPATEPIENIESSKKKPIKATQNVAIKETPKPKRKESPSVTEKQKETPSVAEKKKEKNQDPKDQIKDDNTFHNIIVLRSLACKKVKNNQPLYPGKRFPTDIGRVFCHSLLDNNTGKYNDIYHIWYMNGNLKSKVRIRVREGKEIPAVSHREVKNSDKGTWKIEITDSDKKILDTVIFEVV